MNQNNIFSSKNIKTAILIAILVMAVVLVTSLFQAPKYKSTAKLLVVVNQDNVDSYTATRTAGYVADILSEVAYSSSFVNSVLKSDFDLKDDLGSVIEKREANWKKMVSIKSQEDKGIIIIDVLHRDRGQAENFAQAITYSLSTKHQLYHGLGDRVAVKIIDTPATSEKWAQPKIARNSLLGLLAGLVVGLTFIIIFPEQKLLGIFNGKKTEPYHEPKDFEFIPRPEEEKISQPATAEPITDISAAESQNQDNQYYNW